MVAPYLAFRLLFYGAWLPNTYLAKVGGSSFLLAGVGYLLRAFTHPFGVVMIAMMVYAMVRFARSRRSPLVLLTGFGVVAQASFVLWSGGDWMPSSRFVVPVLPLLAVSAMVGLNDVSARSAARLPTLAVAALVCSAALVVTQGGRLTAAYGDHYWRTAHGLDTRLMLGRWMANHLPRDTVVAYGDMGALPYASGLVFIDLNGLTDAVVGRLAHDTRRGHSKPDERRDQEVSYLLLRDPDLVIVVTGDDASEAGWRAIGYGARLLDEPRFHEAYERAGTMLAYPPGKVARWPDGRSLVVYRRRGRAFPGLREALDTISMRVASR